MTINAAMNLILMSLAVLNILYQIMSLLHFKLFKGILVSRTGKEKSLVLSEGRSRLHARSLMWDSIPEPRDHALSWRLTLNHWATQVSQCSSSWLSGSIMGISFIIFLQAIFFKPFLHKWFCTFPCYITWLKRKHAWSDTYTVFRRVKWD